jgi:competence protein ComEA
LTRIVAINWLHAAATGGALPTFQVRAPSVTEEEEEVSGLAVAFGGGVVSDGDVLEVDGSHDIQTDTLSVEVFRVFTRRIDGVLVNPIQIRPRAVLPLVEVEIGGDGQVVRGAVALEEERARGALFVFPSRLPDAPRELGVFDVRIRGDAIIDVSDRAVDAEFVRSQLPTGDRPLGSDAGVQGGTFESWFYLSESATEEQPNQQTLREIFASERVDLNTAGVDELTTLPGIGQAFAENILEFRESREGPITDPTELAEVPGITEDQIREWGERFEPFGESLDDLLP